MIMKRIIPTPLNASFPRMSHNIEHAGETRVADSGNNRRPAKKTGNETKKGAASYSPALHRSTIGAGGLNFSVRDGKRWDTAAIATRKGVDLHDKQGPIQRPLRTKARRKTTIAQRRQNVAAQGNRSGESVRAISSARLWRRRLYTCALSTSSSRTTLIRSPHLAAGFALRCLQRLSKPDADTRRCTWRHNRQTGGLSNTVLSY